MPSTSETGHAKNAANFEDLISFCTGYGATYNPSKATLQVANLQILRTDALAKLQAVKVSKTSFDNATNERQAAFKPIKPLSTRIINALSACGASELVIADAKTINRKIQGSKANGSTNPLPTDHTEMPTPTGKTVSTSQQSYDSIIDHFAKLIETVTQEASYTPNETELQTGTLNMLSASLQTANTNLVNSFTTWSNARIERDNVLYNVLTGLVQTALDVKQYVKSVYGASSPQYKQVSGLQFKTPKVK